VKLVWNRSTQGATGEGIGGCVYVTFSRIEWGFPHSSPLSHGNLWAVLEVAFSEENVLTTEPIMTAPVSEASGSSAQCLTGKGHAVA
jgi:hypothetical protein